MLDSGIQQGRFLGRPPIVQGEEENMGRTAPTLDYEYLHPSVSGRQGIYSVEVICDLGHRDLFRFRSGRLYLEPSLISQ